MKTITTIILTVIAVLFSIQNFDHVPVYIFWGNAVSIRLVFVVAIAGVTGYLIRHFTGIGREERLKKQIQTIRRKSHYAAGKKTEEFDEEEF
ncbi:MAG TPA: hypothetical protein VMW78_01930 [Anaerolineae bacterium]|nr:hypothetical protein [Anaerolineae bacterium]